MELATAFFADSVIVQDGKFYAWGGGIDTTYAASFPAVTNFTLMARVNFEPGECGRPYKIELNIIDEDGHPFGPGAMPPQMVMPQRLTEGSLPVGHSFLTAFNGFEFPKPCKVIFSILVDGHEVGSLTYRAVPMTQAPAPGWQPLS